MVRPPWPTTDHHVHCEDLLFKSRNHVDSLRPSMQGSLSVLRHITITSTYNQSTIRSWQPAFTSLCLSISTSVTLDIGYTRWSLCSSKTPSEDSQLDIPFPIRRSLNETIASKFTENLLSPDDCDSVETTRRVIQISDHLVSWLVSDNKEDLCVQSFPTCCHSWVPHELVHGYLFHTKSDKKK